MIPPMPPSLYFETHGDAGLPVLMVHGMLSSRSQWIPNVPALREAGYRPVVIELLGHGRSPSPEEPERYTPDAYAAEFESIRAAIGAEEWYVIGQSLGAGLTLRYAILHPEHVIAQVFTNSNSALAGPEFFERVKASTARTAADLTRRGRAMIDDNRLNPAKSRSIPEDIRAALAADVALHTPFGYAMTGLNTTANSPVSEIIGKNTVPTLLVQGVREEQFRGAARWAKRNIPLLEVCEADAGHAVNIQAADTFNAAVIDFFRRHPPGNG